MFLPSDPKNEEKHHLREIPALIKPGHSFGVAPANATSPLYIILFKGNGYGIVSQNNATIVKPLFLRMRDALEHVLGNISPTL